MQMAIWVILLALFYIKYSTNYSEYIKVHDLISSYYK
jgi:hypothetical protein